MSLFSKVNNWLNKAEKELIDNRAEQIGRAIRQRAEYQEGRDQAELDLNRNLLTKQKEINAKEIAMEKEINAKEVAMEKEYIRKENVMRDDFAAKRKTSTYTELELLKEENATVNAAHRAATDGILANRTELATVKAELANIDAVKARDMADIAKENAEKRSQNTLDLSKAEAKLAEVNGRITEQDKLLERTQKAFNARIESMDKVIANLTADRDAWKSMAGKCQDALTATLTKAVESKSTTVNVTCEGSKSKKSKGDDSEEKESK